MLAVRGTHSSAPQNCTMVTTFKIKNGDRTPGLLVSLINFTIKQRWEVLEDVKGLIQKAKSHDWSGGAVTCGSGRGFQASEKASQRFHAADAERHLIRK